MNKTYEIYECNFEYLEELVTRLNKRARKLHQPEISLLMKGEHFTKKPGSTQVFESDLVKVFTVEVSGETPGIPGWSFVAAITHEEAGNVVRAYEVVPEEYRTASNRCDHCHQERNRISTYILRSEAGTYKQVGSSCLKDFTGLKDAHAYAALLEEWTDFFNDLDNPEEDDFGSMGSGYFWVDAPTYMAWVLRTCDTRPYLSRGKAAMQETISTADMASSWMADGHGYEGERLSDEHLLRAKEIISWAQYRFDGMNPKSDYEWNCYVVSRKQELKPRDFGFFASLYGAYLREQEQQAEDARKAQNSPSHWIGEVGSKLTNLKVTVSFTKDIDGMWGTTHLYKFVDASGNLVVWFSSVNYRLASGDEVVILSASVKSQDEYHGEKQTQITRAKIELANGATWNKNMYCWNPAPEKES